eukprot:362998-Chlamydomonas_euryale.AAC.2
MIWAKQAIVAGLTRRWAPTKVNGKGVSRAQCWSPGHPFQPSGFRPEGHKLVRCCSTLVYDRGPDMEGQASGTNGATYLRLAQRLAANW